MVYYEMEILKEVIAIFICYAYYYWEVNSGQEHWPKIVILNNGLFSTKFQY